MEQSKRFAIRDSLTTTEIADFDTLSEARSECGNLISKDREEGIYQSGSYEIYDKDTNKIYTVSKNIYGTYLKNKSFL